MFVSSFKGAIIGAQAHDFNESGFGLHPLFTNKYKRPYTYWVTPQCVHVYVDMRLVLWWISVKA